MPAVENWPFFLFVMAVIVSLVDIHQRLRSADRKLNLLLSHFNIEQVSSHVRDLAADPKQRLAAIKAYRRETGAGLAEAAAAIEKLGGGPR